MGEVVRVSGTVKWFNCVKGYGFISRDDGDDVFVHASMIDRPNPRKFGQSLDQDEPVQFQIVQDDQGRLQASKVSGPDGVAVKGSRFAYRVTPPPGWRWIRRDRVIRKPTITIAEDEKSAPSDEVKSDEVKGDKKKKRRQSGREFRAKRDAMRKKSAVVDKPSLNDKASGDKASGDKASGDKASGVKASGDNASDDNAPNDKASGDKASGDKAKTDSEIRRRQNGRGRRARRYVRKEKKQDEEVKKEPTAEIEPSKTGDEKLASEVEASETGDQEVTSKMEALKTEDDDEVESEKPSDDQHHVESASVSIEVVVGGTESPTA